MNNTTKYTLITQYDGSSAELGEVVRLTIHGEYCPENSLRGYTREEIETNKCWELIYGKCDSCQEYTDIDPLIDEDNNLELNVCRDCIDYANDRLSPEWGV